jgi:hypothetical protein
MFFEAILNKSGKENSLNIDNDDPKQYRKKIFNTFVKNNILTDCCVCRRNSNLTDFGCWHYYHRDCIKNFDYCQQCEIIKKFLH